MLLVIDELPIFLKRMLHDDGNARRVDEFLSWLRGAIQTMGDNGPVFIVSGSIGLQPLVHRLGIPDRINHFYPIRLQPWDRKTSVECFNRLATGQGLKLDEGVAEAVYETLGLGIPHHVQSFFARIRNFATLRGAGAVTVADVQHVYRTGLLVHDGYIEAGENRHRFPSRLLRDWWAARFRDHHEPLESRCPDRTKEG